MRAARRGPRTITAGDLAAIVACAKLEALKGCTEEAEKRGIERMAGRVRNWMERIARVKLPENVGAKWRDE